MFDDVLFRAGFRSAALQHIAVNPEITVDGDRATARSTWIYLVRGDNGEPTLSKVGHYEDELKQVDGRWLFARRRVFNEENPSLRATDENPVSRL